MTKVNKEKAIIPGTEYMLAKCLFATDDGEDGGNFTRNKNYIIGQCDGQYYVVVDDCDDTFITLDTDEYDEHILYSGCHTDEEDLSYLDIFEILEGEEK